MGGFASSLGMIATPLAGTPHDFDAVLAAAAHARFVLIGEASHGTHEFYRIRAEITKRLIGEHRFDAVAVEADWPDAYRINRYVRGASDDRDAVEALDDFKRFPQWMWRNADVLDFVGWLRERNDTCRDEVKKVGFYGLDLYSLHASMDAVIRYLRMVDPEAARRAEGRYACFDHFDGNVDTYARTAGFALTPSCEREVVSQLTDLRRSAATYARRDGRQASDDLFVAEQNARLVKNAEAYYRTMLGRHVESWNLRDRHMAETLEALADYLQNRSRQPAKIVVWAHNSHLGDARATELGERGELNVGQLVRERYGRDALLVGFTTHAGTVTAASDWGTPAERKTVRPAAFGSYESMFHAAGLGNALLDLRDRAARAIGLATPRLERAIGVVYRPETERQSHYFEAALSRQFDFVLHYDRTRAVEPLERTAVWERGEPPETYPSSLAALSPGPGATRRPALDLRQASHARTVSTGHGAMVSTRAATLPISARRTPVRPWVPMTIRSARRDFARRAMRSAATPTSTRRPCVRMPAAFASRTSRSSCFCAARRWPRSSSL
jgi:erythromycin esterase-like protein